MKSKLLLFVILPVLLMGSAAFAQTPAPTADIPLDTLGVCDTVALVLNVDTTNLTATLELWVYSDEYIAGATAGFTWGGSPNTHFMMSSADSPPEIVNAFSVILSYFEKFSMDTTNAHQRFLFGGTALFNILPPAPTRQLWATYHFSISQWDGWNVDGIKIDTMAFDPSSEWLFSEVAVPDSATGFPLNSLRPYFEGSVEFGNPSLAVDGPNPQTPNSYALYQNYPNPFNPTTEISFDLASRSHVRLTIYNILGQEVTTLVDKDMGAGQKSVTWNAGNNASGVYFYKLTAGDFTQTRKMMLLK